MATKKTTTKTEKTAGKAKAKATAKAKPAAKKAAAKAPKAAKEPGETSSASPAALPRHPKARLAHLHTGKDELAKSLAKSLARADEDTGVIADRLRTASSSQLLRLQAAVETVEKKYGGRDKLIAAIGTAENKSGDKDYLAQLETLSLPNLLDLARSHERRARA